MNRLEIVTKPLTWFTALLLVVLTGCGGGGGGSILGSGGAALRPTVTGVAPAPDAFGVGINNTLITANFSEPMRPITGSATFTLACTNPCTKAPTGTVALDITNRIATFTVTNSPLLPFTSYTATITGARSIATGLALAAPYVWSFTTGAVPDTTRPEVLSTFPADAAVAVPANTLITATFDEDMNPTTIVSLSPAVGTFTLACSPACVTPSPTGTVTYDVPSRTATFTLTPALTVLESGKTYTATIAATAADIAGNTLAGNQGPPPSAYVWTFDTVAAVPPNPVSVLSTSPDDTDVAVCPGAKIRATFDTTMFIDSLTATGAFTVTGPGPLFAPVVGTVALDITNTIATFTPDAPLTNGVTYTATIKGDPTSSGTVGVMDLAIPANTMTSGDKVWTFTAGPATGACLLPVNLGILSTFGIASAGGLTNTGNTKINGNTVLNPNQTCNLVNVDNTGAFGLCGGASPAQNAGDTVITNTYPDTFTADAVMAQLLAKWISISPAGTPLATVLGCGVIGNTGGAGAGIGCSGNSTLPPGAYISATSSTIGVSGDLTLDAGGNPDAVWIIQAPSALSIEVGSRILLTGGAKASNVWWYVGSSATLKTNSVFQGNVLASASISMQNLATSCGRLLSGAEGAGAFVFDTNVVSVPGHPSAPPVCQ